jgi:5-methylcytosine-specific restriction endonuclease McrA
VARPSSIKKDEAEARAQIRAWRKESESLAPKRRRGRPRKHPPVVKVTRRGRGRPRLSAEVVEARLRFKDTKRAEKYVKRLRALEDSASAAQEWQRLRQQALAALREVYKERRRVRWRNARHKRRARKRAATVETVTAKFWATTLALYRNRCAYCGEAPDSTLAPNAGGVLEMDHFVPLARGGSHAPHNVLPACRRCNLDKTDRDPFAFAVEAVGRPYLGLNAVSLYLV